MVAATSPATALPFPTLSMLTIYHAAQPQVERVDSFDDSSSVVREDDATLEARKILYFHSVHSPLSKERKARLMGTVVGMANLARMLNPTGAPAVRSVHSLKQRMVWLEVEPGFFIHATIDLPRAVRVHSRAASASSTSISRPGSPPQVEDEAIWAALRQAYRRFRLLHGSFQNGIIDKGKEHLMLELEAYWSDWIRNWSLNKGQIDGVEKVIGGVPLSTAACSSRISSLVTEFTKSNLSMAPVLLHGDAVLHLPPHRSAPHSRPHRHSSSAPLLSSDDLTALVHYLSSVAPSVHPPPSQPKLPRPRRSQRRPAAAAISTSTARSSWNTMTFGMGDYLVPSLSTLAAISGVNALSNLSLATIAGTGLNGRSSNRARSDMSSMADGLATELREEEQDRLKEIEGRKKDGESCRSEDGDESIISTWGFGRMGKMNWAGLVGGGTASAATRGSKSRPSFSELIASTKADMDTNASDSPISDVFLPSSSVTGRSAISEGSIPSSDDLPSISTASNPIFPSHSPMLASTTPSIADEPMLATEPSMIDVDALSAALDLERLPAIDQLPIEDDKVLIVVSSVTLFCDDDSTMELTVVRRESFTLALISVNPIPASEVPIQSARRLLASISSDLDSAAIPPVSTHRHLAKTGLLSSSHAWTGRSGWSGGGIGTDENEMSSALFESVRGFESDPVILESMVKTNSSHWIAASKSETPAQGSVELVLVLPPKSGRDGLSAVAEELVKLQRAYRDAGKSG